MWGQSSSTKEPTPRETRERGGIQAPIISNRRASAFSSDILFPFIIGYLFPFRPSIILPRVANHAWSLLPDLALRSFRSGAPCLPLPVRVVSSWSWLAESGGGRLSACTTIDTLAIPYHFVTFCAQRVVIYRLHRRPSIEIELGNTHSVSF